MKIAYLCNIYPHTTHTFIRREIDGLEAEGFEIERITIRPSAAAMPTPEDQAEFERTFIVLGRGVGGLIVNILLGLFSRPAGFMRALGKAIRLGYRSDAGLPKYMAYLGEACSVLRHVNRNDVTHIHAHFGTNATTVAMLVKALGGPGYSFMIHGPGEWDCPKFLRIPEKVADATFVTVISDFAKSQTFRWTDPILWDKVHVIRCGVDEDFIEHAVTDVPDVKDLVMIGRFGRSKGHGILFEALERLRAEGVELHVKLIGDGGLRPYIESQIATRKLGDCVTIVGWMDNHAVRDELVRSRAMVLPSFGEGLPVVIMEALALSRPVICTRIAGIGELVINGENGWLVSSGSVVELTDALREVMTTPVSVLSQMGQSGRRLALQKHDAREESRKLGALIRRYAGQSNAAD